MTYTIGSLCTGTGALDMAVLDAIGGHVVWHADPDPGASAILAHRWPAIPNHGDITELDFATVAKIAILTAGFPCTDVSIAGRREGITATNRSGLWHHVARAIDHLRPELVVIENVEGLLSARADRGLGPTDPHVEAAGPDALRALGCVLGDLADLGFDTEWCRVAAAEVGAAHRRNRIFILAWPADTEGEGRPGPGVRGRAAERRAGVADPSRVRCERCGRARDGRPGPADLDLQTADAWGPYAPAVELWASRLGRPAPGPTDPDGRLNPVAVEWLMGLPAGHVTDVPGLSRSQQLHALGNGVVPAQAAAAIRLLLDRACLEVAS
ncbi:DNA cytosine methyltransferase [Embleya sp. NPDC005971]|uniref:DNA cytosine methyltransferase n=1 Tax=Embleya sp. NPDC005971 TaxID=3156724 RepID=UPI0033CD105A